jgi:predicted membrane channel-forming protein YqfA (hemolysin III family)
MENPTIIILIVAIALILVVFMVRSASRDKEHKRVPNYRALFIIGISWLPIGIATHNPGFWGMGAVFMIVGGLNKDKWGKETKWADLSPQARKIKLIFIIGLTTILLAALAYHIFIKEM